MEIATVGRPKKRPADPNRKPVAVTIKGNAEWREWLEEAAKHARMSVSAFVDHGTLLAAKQFGFTKKPPER